MAIQGTLRKAPSGWTVEHRATQYMTPELLVYTWKVTGASRKGNVAFAPDMADGLTLTSVRDRDAWEAYKDGGYLVVETEHTGTVTHAPYPCPKVRKGVETRYQYGAWQAYSKRHGWQTISGQASAA